MVSTYESLGFLILCRRSGLISPQFFVPWFVPRTPFSYSESGLPYTMLVEVHQNHPISSRQVFVHNKLATPLNNRNFYLISSKPTPLPGNILHTWLGSSQRATTFGVFSCFGSEWWGRRDQFEPASLDAVCRRGGHLFPHTVEKRRKGEAHLILYIHTKLEGSIRTYHDPPTDPSSLH